MKFFNQNYFVRMECYQQLKQLRNIIQLETFYEAVISMKEHHCLKFRVLTPKLYCKNEILKELDDSFVSCCCSWKTLQKIHR